MAYIILYQLRGGKDNKCLDRRLARLEINLSLIKQTNGGRKCGIVTRPGQQ